MPRFPLHTDPCPHLRSPNRPLAAAFGAAPKPFCPAAVHCLWPSIEGKEGFAIGAEGPPTEAVWLPAAVVGALGVLVAAFLHRMKRPPALALMPLTGLSHIGAPYPSRVFLLPMIRPIYPLMPSRALGKFWSGFFSRLLMTMTYASHLYCNQWSDIFGLP